MLITLITDASWCPTTGVGGWAAFGVARGDRRRKWGAFKEVAISATECELRAIANGLHMVSNVFATTKGDKIIIQSDNQEALDILKRKIMRYHDIRVKIYRYLREMQINADFRHVKAHIPVGKRDKRHHVNVWCDHHAKNAMRIARDLVLAQAQDIVQPGALLKTTLDIPIRQPAPSMVDITNECI